MEKVAAVELASDSIDAARATARERIRSGTANIYNSKFKPAVRAAGLPEGT